WRPVVGARSIARPPGLSRMRCYYLVHEETRERRAPMPVVKVADLASGRLQSPSLDDAEEFLVHFGMVRSERTPNALYMRGTDPAHHLHVTHLGPSKFIGLAFFVGPRWVTCKWWAGSVPRM